MEFIFLDKLNSPQIQEALILDVIKKQTPPRILHQMNA